MRLLNFLFLITLLVSCNNKNKKQTLQSTTEEKWEVTITENETNTYSKSGLLDTTYQTETIYFHNQIASVFKSFILRIYDTVNNLKDEKTIQVLEHNKLSKERIMKYDIKRNLKEEIIYSDSVCDAVTKRIYNNLNQEIRRMEIYRIPKANPRGWNADSIVAHYYDKKPKREYDTTLITSLYYKNGGLMEELYSRLDGITNETLMIIYSNHKKILTYGINSKGDTVSCTKCVKDGNLTKETKEDKINSFVYKETWYDGDKKVKEIEYSRNKNCKRMETFKYDIKGNEIENISSKTNCD